jgi:hypothetical protein
VHLDHSEDYSFKEIESNCFIAIVEELLGSGNLILLGDFNIITDNNNAYRTIAKKYIDVSKVL